MSATSKRTLDGGVSMDMAEMSEDLVDLIRSAAVCYLGTASKEGVPDVAPLASVRALSHSSLAMAATLHGKSATNLRENPRAALVVHSTPPPKRHASIESMSQVTGGQIKGRATVLTSGEIHEETQRLTAETLGAEAAEIFDATLVLTIDEIYTITPRRTADQDAP